MKLPPEWWPQAAVMLTWPHAEGDWGDCLDQVERVFLNLTREIATRQRVVISAASVDTTSTLPLRLRDAGVPIESVSIYYCSSNDIWVRDHGPLTVMDEQGPILLDFQFNGWGGKYPADKDNAITTSLHSQGAFSETRIQHINHIIEGGAIEVNGMGCLLTTADCLTLDTRNPEISEVELEGYFRDWFGCSKIHWLRNGQLAGDDTDGHIDTLARFCSENLIVYQGCTDPSDEHYLGLNAMADELQSFTDHNDQPYRLCALPLPAAIYNAQGERLPAGYANFLVINDAVLMPGYDDPMDVIAAAKLAECFPGREIVTIDCRALVKQYGSLHCATMQLPAGTVPA